MKFEVSKHAKSRMKSRGISSTTIRLVLNDADTFQVQDGTIKVYSKIVTENSKPYLYRVFVNDKKNPPLVITAYKTSKIEKYGY